MKECYMYFIIRKSKIHSRHKTQYTARQEEPCSDLSAKTEGSPSSLQAGGGTHAQSPKSLALLWLTGTHRNISHPKVRFHTDRSGHQSPLDYLEIR